MSPIVGITALVPPELVYACGKRPLDLNNFVPNSKIYPRSKLCAWTATWREMLLMKEILVDSLVVVAGGDCHNSLVDGQRAALSGIPAHYFFYPFDGDREYLMGQLEKLSGFLGGVSSPEMFWRIKKLKEEGFKLEKKRVEGRISGSRVFGLMVSFSDFKGDIDSFEKELEAVELENMGGTRIALIGVPPIYPDFHLTAEKLGLNIVYDELPYEFLRLSGADIGELAENYKNYTFARDIDFRMDFLERELDRRKVDGIIHYTQYACHHVLEDEIIRERLDYPVLTIQGDLPRNTPEQLRLRLEAFSEILGRRG